jgi:tetratricopeptide (TPR) repeat protein
MAGLLTLALMSSLLLADEPRQLTEEQKARLKERNQYLAEANRLRKAGQLPETIATLEKALAIDRQVFGDRHEEVALSLESLAQVHEIRADWTAGRKARQEVLAIRSGLYGKDDWRVTNARLALAYGDFLACLNEPEQQQLQQADEMSRRAAFLAGQGKNREALPLAQQVAETRRKLLGETHPDYASSLNILAAVHHGIGDYLRARDLWQQTCAFRKQVLGENHPDYASSLNNLGAVCHHMGDYARALPLLEQTLKLRKQLLGEKHRAYADSLNNLAALCKDMGDYARAQGLYEEALALRKKHLGENHLDYAQSLHNLGVLCRDLGEYPRALTLLEQARDLRKRLLTEEHPFYANTLNNLAALYQLMGDYSRALPLYEQACSLNRKLLGERHPDYPTSLNNLALLYKDMGNYTRALALMEQTCELVKNRLGENHPLHAQCLNNLALLCREMGEYPRALALSQKALEQRKRLWGEKHPFYADSLDSLGTLYLAMGDYPSALTHLEQARELNKRLQGKDRAVSANLNNLGALYQKLGDYPRALDLYSQVHALHKQRLGEDHPLCVKSLNNLGMLAHDRGDYSRALALLGQACDLCKRRLGEDHPEYADSLNNLALVYRELGDFLKALPLLEQALAIRQRRLGENNPAYAASLNNLALVCHHLGDYPRTRKLLEEACDLRKRLLGEGHPDYARSLTNLARLFHDLRDYTRARDLYEQAHELHRKVPGEDHPDFAKSLVNLGHLYFDMGDYPRAQKLVEQACELRKKALGEGHPDYAGGLNNLANICQARGDDTRALALSREALDRFTRCWQETFHAVGERQRLRLLDHIRLGLNNYLVAALKLRTPDAGIYEAVLTWKGAVTARQSSEVFLRDQPDLRPLLERLSSVRAQLAKQAFDQPAPAQRDAWLRQLDQLRTDKEKLEGELAQAARNVPALHRPAPTLLQIRKALPSDTVLIDFLTFSGGAPPRERTGKEELQTRLLAFVVSSDRPVQLLFLGDLTPVERQVEAWRQAVRQNNTQALQAAAAELHRLVWQPCQPYLGNARIVLLSPDGPLIRFPFAALPGKTSGTFLLEDLTLGYVASGRQLADLAQPDAPPTTPSGLLALGGLDYDQVPGSTNPFAPLPGTGLEADSIRALFARRFPDQRTALLRGAEAVPDRLRAELKRRYAYLHLATHGFFDSPDRLLAMRGSLLREDRGFSPSQRRAQAEVLDLLPLLKSGLVLSGANRAAGGAALLTAQEVEQLDLRGCDLCVLSACETSLGELTQGDGVLGLQRAFHAAGVRSLVASLWSVDDAATSVLMEQLYSELWRKEQPLSRLEALRQAQLFVLRHPERVLQRRKELRAELAKRGLGEEGLRGPKGKEVVKLPDGGKVEAGPQTSPPLWWAAFLLSGDVGPAPR